MTLHSAGQRVARCTTRHRSRRLLGTSARDVASFRPCVEDALCGLHTASLRVDAECRKRDGHVRRAQTKQCSLNCATVQRAQYGAVANRLISKTPQRATTGSRCGSSSKNSPSNVHHHLIARPSLAAPHRHRTALLGSAASTPPIITIFHGVVAMVGASGVDPPRRPEATGRPSRDTGTRHRPTHRKGGAHLGNYAWSFGTVRPGRRAQCCAVRRLPRSR